MKKITFMLLVLIAAVSANAQSGPMKQSQLGNSTTVDELVGWFYWWNKTTTENLPTTNGNTANATLYPNGTSNGRYVAFTKINADSIMIYNMFEQPVKAKVVLNVSGKTPLAKADYTGYIDIPTGQVVQKSAAATVLNGEIKLAQSTWVTTDAETGAGQWSSYSTVRMYLNANSWFIDNNWIRTTYIYTGGTGTNEQYNGNTYYTGPKYIPGYNYSYTRAVEALSGTDLYKASNAVMFVEFDKSIQNYTNTTYAVQVTQEGNTVKVQNFNGGTTTVNIDLRADNSIDIAPNQTGTFSSTEYTYYPSPEGEIGYYVDTEIEGTGTEGELTWGSYSRRIASSGNGYQYSSGKIVLLNKDVEKFRYPVALTISDAGIASFSSEKNVDFSQATKLGDTPETVALTPNVVTDFTAQKATLEALDAPIPANYGVFVKGEAGDYEVPTVAEAATPNIVNNLQPTSNQEVHGDGSTIYALGVKDGKPGVMLVTAGTTIAANKAYLVGNFGSGAKFISFDGETTSIDGVELSADEAAPAYNLQGQRVGQNYRGIVVKNGKKSVVR